VAAPRFLGLLRSAIASATSEQPYATVDKDVVGKDAGAIERLLDNA
jgi:protein required for attachment to host cells